jgi:hypothetical protein
MKKPTAMSVGLTLNRKCERLTIGLDLGDRSSYYCALNAGCPRPGSPRSDFCFVGWGSLVLGIWDSTPANLAFCNKARL